MKDIQDYLRQQLGMTTDGSATAIITLLVFILGYIITGIVEFGKNIAKRIRYKSFYKFNLDKLIPSIQHQTSSIEKFSNQIDINKNITWEIEQILMPYLSVLSQLDFKDLYDSCVNGIENSRFAKLVFTCRNIGRKHNQKTVSNILLGIEFFKQHQHNIFVSVKDFLSEYNEFNNQRNTALLKVRELIDKIILTFDNVPHEQIEPKLKVYVLAIDDINVKLKMQENYRNARIMNDNYVERLLALNRNRENYLILNKYIKILYPIELNNALSESQLAYENQKKSLEIYAQTIQELAKSFKKNSSILNVSCSEL